MKDRRFSNSPLLDPSVSILVVVSSDRRELTAIDPGTHAIYQRTIAAMSKATRIAKVPIFDLSCDALEQAQASLATHAETPCQRRFRFEENTSPWSHKPFVEALTAQDRPALVLAGFWLEHEVLATALHALADGYDVYLLVDATPPRSRCASDAARERLSQAGAMPVTASQVINEWSFETTDAATRAALKSLLPILRNLDKST
jgi:nicotinamidase-related amidase